MPLISVIVPTRDRPQALERLLRALIADPHQVAMEIVVADDGSAPGSLVWLDRLAAPFAIVRHAQPPAGPSVARNAGARAARGDLLLFLDDDVEPQPGTVAAHAAAHGERRHLIGLGDLPPVIEDASLFGVTLRGWWESMIEEIRRPGHRFSYRNLLTGHVSIRRDDFDAIGGFDPQFTCHEDWEFGYRALTHGLEMCVVPGAVAWHHERTTLPRALARKRDEGRADVQLVRRHPALLPGLPLTFRLSRRHRLWRRLAWHPAIGDRLAAGVMRLMPLALAVNLRFRWRALLDMLLVYWYWRGVADALPSPAAVATLGPLTAAVPDLVIDLADGIGALESRLDTLRPDGVVLAYQDKVLGIVNDVGREPLRGRHLRPLIATHFRVQVQTALARDGRMPEPLAALVESWAFALSDRPSVAVKQPALPPTTGGAHHASPVGTEPAPPLPNAGDATFSER